MTDLELRNNYVVLSTTELNENDCCNVCSEPIDKKNNIKILKCGHKLHTKCFENITNNKCPICNHLIEDNTITFNLHYYKKKIPDLKVLSIIMNIMVTLVVLFLMLSVCKLENKNYNVNVVKSLLKTKKYESIMTVFIKLTFVITFLTIIPAIMYDIKKQERD